MGVASLGTFASLSNFSGGQIALVYQMEVYIRLIPELAQHMKRFFALQSLQVNNTPYRDHGIEVLYRFADFDPFQRTRYFGYAQNPMILNARNEGIAFVVTFSIVRPCGEVGCDLSWCEDIYMCTSDIKPRDNQSEPHRMFFVLR